MKKVLAIILASIVMLSMMSVSVSATGDTMATATKVTFGTKYQNELTESDGTDFYKIVLTESGKVTINATIFLDVYLGVYDEKGNDVINKYTYFSVAYQPMDLYNIVMDLYLTSGVYYVDFRRAHEAGEYRTTFSFESAKESIKENQGGSNESLNEAFNIELNKKYQGQIAENEGKDFYKFTLKNKTKVKMDINAFQYVYCSVCDENGAIVKDFSLLGYNYNINTSYEVELDDGVYYICFSKGNGHCGNYDFTISQVGVTVPDEPSEPDEPETPSTPENPEEPGSSSGEEPFFITILVAIWEFLVNVFMFLFGWILM